MKNINLIKTTSQNRKGLIDVWNAKMVESATFSKHDIPLCPTTATDIPKCLIGYDEAKTIHNKKNSLKQKDYHIDAFVHFYVDDSKFDGKRNSFWTYPDKVLEILKHFDGCICVDVSTYSDFPDPIKRWNYYRMNAFGYWLTTKGIKVISNVRWNDKSTWHYCFDGNPHNSMLCLGTIASGLKYKANYDMFHEGLLKMAEVLKPHTLLVYGSINYPCFDELKGMGITVVEYRSKTSEVYERRQPHE